MHDNEVEISNITENATANPTAEAKKPTAFDKFKRGVKNFFTYNPVGKRPRIWELDLIRGIILFFVTLDHVCLFAYYWKIIVYKTAFGAVLEDFSVFYLESTFRKFVEPLGLWTLCFLSGISCQFSRSSVRRMAKFWIITALFMGGYAILHFIMPDLVVGVFIFNIVPILTISMTLWYLIDHLECPMWARIVFGATGTAIGLAFYVLNCVKAGGIFVNDILASGITIDNPFLAILVYNKSGYHLSPNNFEPLFPHLGFFFLGAIFGRYFYKNKKTRLSRPEPPKAIAPIMLLGKHSLKAFILLPPIILAAVWLVVHFVQLFV